MTYLICFYQKYLQEGQLLRGCEIIRNWQRTSLDKFALLISQGFAQIARWLLIYVYNTYLDYLLAKLVVSINFLKL